MQIIRLAYIYKADSSVESDQLPSHQAEDLNLAVFKTEYIKNCRFSMLNINIVKNILETINITTCIKVSLRQSSSCSCQNEMKRSSFPGM